MAIVWTTDLNTGIDVIDDQHRNIVDYINQLELASKEHDRPVIGQVLNDLVAYTVSHFAFEESLQEASGYKFAKPHRAIHELFIKRVAKYQQRYNAGADIAEQLHSMLKTWLIHHIRRDDAAYVSAVRPNITTLVEDNRATGWLSRALGTFFKLAPDKSIQRPPQEPTRR
jgi:hemerythrin